MGCSGTGSASAVDAVVEFPKPLASLEGRFVRLRFGLKNARLYAFWVE